MIKYLKKFYKLIFLLVFSFSVFVSCSYKTNEVYIETTIKEVLDTELSYYTFRTDYLLKEHFDKHGKEMGFKTAKEYENAANKVIASKDALIKEEKDDGDYVYYIVETNEIVFLSKDGYIRSYFNPAKGKKYFDKQ